MTGALLQAALPLLTAACLAWWALPWCRARATPLLVCLAAALALGVAGMGELASLLLGGGVVASVTVQLALLAGAAGLAWHGRRGAVPPVSAPATSSVSPLAAPLGLVFAASALAATLGSIVLLRTLPHGVWDSWAVWNNRARFLYRAGEHWTVIFDPQLQHPEYPVLLAVLNSALWRLVGSDVTAVPRALSFMFTFLCVGIVVTALRHLRGPVQGWLAGLAVLALPHFAGQGAQQGADVPFACFVAAALACVAVAETQGENRRTALALAGVFAGLAVWTKNEGLLFALSLVVALVVVGRVRGDRSWASVRALASGLAPFVVLLWAIRMMFVRSPMNVVEPDASPWLLLGRLFDWSRHAVILDHSTRFVRGIWPPAETHPPLLVLGLLVAYVAAAGLRRRRAESDTTAVLPVVLALVAAGYYVVYLVTRYDVAWYVKSSVDRLFVQYWPALVLSVFLWARSPDELRGPARAEAPEAASAPAA